MKDEVYLSTAITAAKKAGALIKKEYGHGSRVSYSYKDAHNIVTKTDIESESIIISTIQEKFPNHSIFSEEKGAIENSSDYLWIIDPLDGTTNFSRKLPYFCVSIGFSYKNELLMGVIYQPITDELFTALKSKGAFLNGRIIRIHKSAQIERAVIAHSRGATSQEKTQSGHIVNALSKTTHTLRMLGSAALNLCQTASGTFDAVVANGLVSYDIAAGLVIAKEAGAIITDFKGKPWNLTLGRSDILVSNRTLHKQLIHILKPISSEARNKVLQKQVLISSEATCPPKPRRRRGNKVLI